jgi:acetoin utilization deacetylase AcuC-like enzyme
MLPFSLVYREDFYLPMGAHVFPGLKYKLVHDRLLETRVASAQDFLRCEQISVEDLARVHDGGFLNRLLHGTLAEKEIRRMELPYSKALVQATMNGCGGTLAAARLALRNGIAMCVGGGFHHAFPDHGEGFCMLHDVAVTIRRLQHDRAIRSAMVVDLDVHHGNGTAAIFPPLADALVTTEQVAAGELIGPCEPSADGVFTVSLHQRNNYPAIKPQSSLDCHLEDGTADAGYLAVLDLTLAKALDAFRPDLLVYLAGADPYEDDQLGGLSLTLDGLKERDLRVFRAAQAHGISIASIYAGGYARKLADTVTIHCNTVVAAAEVFAHHGASSC